jgi:excisionase family DNA binding protein
LNQNDPETSPLLTYQEAADFLRVSTRTLRRYVQDGRLQAIRWRGGHPRIAHAELVSLIAKPYAPHATHLAMTPAERRSRRTMKPEPKLPVYLTVKQLAERYQVTPLAVYGWIRAGLLAATKLGPGKNSSVRVHRDDMLAFG